MAKKPRGSLAHPYYDSQSQIVIQRFLAAYLLDAKKALEQEKKLAGSDATLFPFCNRIRHFEAIIQAVEHLNWLSRRRQWHLFDIDNPQLLQVLEQWDQQHKG